MDEEPTKRGLNIWMPMGGRIIEPMPIRTHGATCGLGRARGPTARGDKRGAFAPHSSIIILKTVKLKVKYASLQHNDRGLLIRHPSRETIPYQEFPWQILLSLSDPLVLLGRHLLPRNSSAGYDCSPRKTRSRVCLRVCWHRFCPRTIACCT